ncbi:uncharacterized protein LOC143552433 [Bidens hawaiensis]|uniref:uncharacterized protein LOC143552433 n=1 Tax=Bidens hawaiensis TaxID=980011 RepID=UPI004048EFD5
MGKIPVYEKKFARKEDAVRIKWRKQSFPYPAVIFVKHVIEMLQSYTGGGTLFKLNFLVLFNSIVGGTNKSATVNQQFLSSIKNEDDICNMEWCSYIVTCLKRSKEEWSGKEPYNGPLTFLAVLYAHEQQLRRAPDKIITPAIRYVTTGFLVDLVGSMHVDGPCLNDSNQEDSQLTRNGEAEVKLQAHIESSEGQNDEDQTALDQNASVVQEKEDGVQHQTVNVPQDEEDEDQFQPSIPDPVLNLKSAVGPLCAQSPSGLSANLVHCNRLELPRHKKVSHALHTI